MTLNVQRAISELRLGIPVCIDFAGNSRFLYSCDTLTNLPEASYVLLSNTRSQFLGFNIGERGSRLYIDNKHIDIKEVNEIISGFEIGKSYSYSTTDDADEACLDLLKFSRLLPAGIISDQGSNSCVRVKFEDIINYKQSSCKVKRICSSPLTIRSKHDTEIVMYRACGIDHHAIILRGFRANPWVRIHSSCYTGDILGVLTCDCGDQLRSTIDYMLNNEGGVILYLNQEGRGIGLINKIRAYNLQHNGNLDTVEANNVIGFNDDERDFNLASEILKDLGIVVLRLITDNPKKLDMLRASKIIVTECISSVVQHNNYNARYIRTKRQKMNHRGPLQ